MKQGDEAMNVLVLKYLYFHKILCMRITTWLVLIVLTLTLCWELHMNLNV